MLKNYFKVSLRTFWRYKIYSIVNVIGLGVAIAASLLIAVYIIQEFSFDRHHTKADRIHRITLEQESVESKTQSALTPPGLAPALQREIPVVKQAVRISNRSPGEHLIRRDDNLPYDEADIAYADAGIFQVFDFTVIRGSSETALKDPYTIVLTESASQRYFGETDVVGKRLSMQMPGGNDTDLRITAVIRDIPETSHFTFDMLGSIATLQRLYPGPTSDEEWKFFWCYTYVLLHRSEDVTQLNQYLPPLVEQHMVEPFEKRGVHFTLYPQALTDIHLRSGLESEWRAGGNIRQVRILSGIALLTLIIGLINYVNFTTAQASRRALEVGVRKTFGAFRRQLVAQFLVDTGIIIIISGIIGLVLTDIFIPLLNQKLGLSLNWSVLNDGWIWFLIVLIMIFGILCAGIYPSLLLSSFQPTRLAGRALMTKSSGSYIFRKSLVIAQLSASVILIIATILIAQQVRYMQSKDTGFDRDHLIVLPNHESMQRSISPETIKSSLLRYENIQSVSGIQRVPSSDDIFTNWAVRPEGFIERIPVMQHLVDSDFVETMGLEIVEGRNFNPELATDREAFLINETAARRFGWQDPVGKILYSAVDGVSLGPIIGVVNDFHVASLHYSIEPIVFKLPFQPGHIRHYAVRVTDSEWSTTINILKDKWFEFAPDKAFEYIILDDYQREIYVSDERFGWIVAFLSVLVVLIACLGLLGLATYAADSRTKEIGVRKVHGASVMSIVTLLSKDFLKLILLANALAWPVAHFAATKWLESFAYRIDPGWMVFITAGAIIVFVSLFTIGYKVIRAAMTNPVESLRYE